MIPRTVHFLPDSPYANWFAANCTGIDTGKANEFYSVWHGAEFIDKSLITVIEPGSAALDAIIDRINQDGGSVSVYVHYLESVKAEIINRIANRSVKVIWILWSEDFYLLPKLNFKKYDAYCTRFFKQQKKAQRKKLTLKQWLGRQKMIYIDGLKMDSSDHDWDAIYRSIGRADYCLTGIREEGRIIRENLNPKIRWRPFSYISATNGIPAEGSLDIKKDLVQVGNSADPANNHYEALRRLRRLGLREKVLVPLSYGADQAYTDQLTGDVGRLMPAGQLILLKDFMEKDAYYDMLKRVKSAIFPHNIQQGFGNIIALMSFGAKVFLKQKNPLFAQFKEWGVEVYSIEKDMTRENVSSPLSKEAMQRNQQILFDLFSEEKVKQCYRDTLAL